MGVQGSRGSWRTALYTNATVIAATASLAIFCCLLIFLNFFISSSSNWFLTFPSYQLPSSPSAATTSSRVDNALFPLGRDITSMVHMWETLGEYCNLAQGDWVPDKGPPLYTSEACQYIQESRQNCVRNGRPDSNYIFWRWKPSDCELPRLDPAYFLHLMRGKKLALIGDSLARNHMESLLCALAQVEGPAPINSNLNSTSEFIWHFPSYNFTFRNFWSPFLVNYSEEIGHDGLFKLYLDRPDMAWASQLSEYDVAVVSTGYWYHRKSLYYVDNNAVGASTQLEGSLRTIEVPSAICIALTNVLKYMAMEYAGIIILRTVTVDHFENGGFSDGGSCERKKPYSSQVGGVPGMPWMNRQINKAQVEAFEKAMAYVNDSSRFKLLNVTYSVWLRPDGHPGPYRNVHFYNDPVNDCLHWCLPGPIDAWNQFLVHSIHAAYANN